MKKLLFIFIFPILLIANNLETELRINGYSTGQRSTIEPTGIYPWQPLSWLDVNLGVKVGLGTFNWESLDYMADARVFFLKRIFNVGARMYHTNRVSDNFSETTWLAKLEYDVMPLPFFGLFGTFGVLIRLNSIGFVTWIPTWRSSGMLDLDIAARFGLRVQPSDNFKIDLSLCSLDEFEVLNLHNPFVEGRFTYKYNEDLTPYLYLRYRVLLGFGRLDVWTVGLGMNWNKINLF